MKNKHDNSYTKKRLLADAKLLIDEAVEANKPIGNLVDDYVLDISDRHYKKWFKDYTFREYKRITKTIKRRMRWE